MQKKEVSGLNNVLQCRRRKWAVRTVSYSAEEGSERSGQCPIVQKKEVCSQNSVLQSRRRKLAVKTVSYIAEEGS